MGDKWWRCSAGKVMAAYCEFMTSHQQADCLETGISSRPNFRKSSMGLPTFTYPDICNTYCQWWWYGWLLYKCWLLLQVLKGHDDHVITCLEFCGNKIVSGSDDNTLKVWSAVNGKVGSFTIEILLLVSLFFCAVDWRESKTQVQQFSLFPFRVRSVWWLYCLSFHQQISQCLDGPFINLSTVTIKLV